MHWKKKTSLNSLSNCGKKIKSTWKNLQRTQRVPTLKKNKKTLKKYTQLCQLHLGGEVNVTGNLCKNDNVVQIHIRQYGGENQKPYPTKKGVTMSLTEWLTLECFLSGMEAALKIYSEQDSEASWYLGCNCL